MNADFTPDLALLRCPRCGAGLGLTDQPAENDDVVCPSCRERYPVREGVLGLVYPDAGWFWQLHETVAYSDLAEKVLGQALEQDRLDQHKEMTYGVLGMTEEMTEAALQLLGPAEGRVLLEAGCGSCGHAKLLADAGFKVFALDLNASELLAPRPRDHLEKADDFHAAYLNKDDVFSREELNFHRIAGELTNLPLADASVDVVFSRAMLHHLDPLEPAIVEIGRVLKPGGSWVAAAEPAASMLDFDPLSVVNWSIDYQEGLHEQCPPLSTYLRGFRDGGMQLERYDVWSAQWRINLGLRQFRRLRLNWSSRQLADRGRRRFSRTQLRLMNSCGNFLTRRNDAPPKPRRLDPARERSADPGWLFEPAAHRRELRAALRQLVPLERLANPARLGRLKHPEVQLKGFRLPNRVEGRLACQTTRRAVVYLPRPTSPANKLTIDYLVPAPQVHASAAAEVLLNGQALGAITIAESGRQRAEFAIQPATAQEPGALEVEIKIETPWKDLAGHEPGLAIETIAVS